MAVITISRQVAALGDEIAASLADELNYKFVGRKDIEQRIVELGFPEEKLKKYDERKPGFFASLVKDRDEYLDYLQTAVLEAACDNKTILIGRGACVVLEKIPSLISLRFIADDTIRMHRLENEFSWDEKKAKQRIDESDENRRGFHKSFFNLDINDPSRYLLTINTGLLDVPSSTQLIAGVVKTLVTPEKEEQSKKRLRCMLDAQLLINKLVFEYKLNIEFLRASIEGGTVVLHGIADSSALVERALKTAAVELPDYTIKSAISIVQDFKAYP